MMGAGAGRGSPGGGGAFGGPGEPGEAPTLSEEQLQILSQLSSLVEFLQSDAVCGAGGGAGGGAGAGPGEQALVQTTAARLAGSLSRTGAALGNVQPELAEAGPVLGSLAQVLLRLLSCGARASARVAASKSLIQFSFCCKGALRRRQPLLLELTSHLVERTLVAGDGSGGDGGGSSSEQLPRGAEARVAMATAGLLAAVNPPAAGESVCRALVAAVLERVADRLEGLRQAMAQLMTEPAVGPGLVCAAAISLGQACRVTGACLLRLASTQSELLAALLKPAWSQVIIGTLEVVGNPAVEAALPPCPTGGRQEGDEGDDLWEGVGDDDGSSGSSGGGGGGGSGGTGPRIDHDALAVVICHMVRDAIRGIGPTLSLPGGLVGEVAAATPAVTGALTRRPLPACLAALKALLGPVDELHLEHFGGGAGGVVPALPLHTTAHLASSTEELRAALVAALSHSCAVVLRKVEADQDVLGVPGLALGLCELLAYALGVIPRFFADALCGGGGGGGSGDQGPALDAAIQLACMCLPCSQSPRTALVAVQFLASLTRACRVGPAQWKRARDRHNASTGGGGGVEAGGGAAGGGGLEETYSLSDQAVQQHLVSAVERNGPVLCRAIIFGLADTTAVPLTAVPRVADIVAPVVVPLRDHWREWTAACLADPAFPANDVFSQEAKVSERANG